MNNTCRIVKNIGMMNRGLNVCSNKSCQEVLGHLRTLEFFQCVSV
jgi:hypothetical protein